jgi:hypothetical protein
LEKRPNISQEGSPLMYTRVAPVARRKVEMKKGEVTKGEQLRVAGRGRGDLNRYTRENSNGPLGPGEGGGEEGGVASSSSHLNYGGVGGDLLDEGQVRAVLAKKMRQARKVGHEVQVKGEDGEERARGLPIVPTATLHRG